MRKTPCMLNGHVACTFCAVSQLAKQRHLPTLSTISCEILSPHAVSVSLNRTSGVDVIMRNHAGAENPDGHAESAADQKLFAVLVIL
jgi:hypothetical protein